MSLKEAKELAVLSVLKAHSAHGHVIAAELERSFGPFLGLSRANIYAILRRFGERGWVKGTTERVGRMPEREVFELTKQGERAYLDLRSRISGAGDLPQSSLIALLLAETDDDNPLDLNLMIENRERALSQLQHGTSVDHADHPAVRLALALLTAEVSVLRELRADSTHAGGSDSTN